MAKADAAGIVSGCAGADHPDQPGGFGANAARLGGGGHDPCRGAARELRPAQGLTRMDVILVLNAGSSSLKFQIFALEPAGLERQIKGQIDGIGVHPRFRAADAAGAALIDERPDVEAIPDLPAATRALKVWLRGLSGYSLRAVGHRVVHGGPDLCRARAHRRGRAGAVAGPSRRWLRCTSPAIWPRSVWCASWRPICPR